MPLSQPEGQAREMLFIGGSLDGQRREVSDRTVSSGVAFVPTVETQHVSNQPMRPFDVINVQYEQYVLHRVAGNQQLFEVFVPLDWTGDQTIAALLRGYHA